MAQRGIKQRRLQITEKEIPALSLKAHTESITTRKVDLFQFLDKAPAKI